MTVSYEPSLREQAEDFLFTEAALPDDWRLDEMGQPVYRRWPVRGTRHRFARK